MALPGKLCIGILEEDNPLRAYFRFKPLLIDQQGSYVPYEDHARYGDEGCIRIVPDKNEAYHFKARMRAMGLFCVVDLRDHPDENDKIRPNKNYRAGGPEINNSIIYSDVVRAPAPNMIFEILRAQPDAELPAPHTPSVLLRGEDVYPERYGWESVEEGEDRVRLVPTDERCAPDSVQIFDLPGFREETISFAIVPAAAMDAVTDLPDPLHREPREPHPAEAGHPAPEAKPAHAPEPVAVPEPAPEAKPAPAAPEAAAPEKPWLSREAQAAPPAPEDPRMSVRQRILAAQTGLNPRRGRSLQELVDEKWVRSRVSQLDNAAADLATGMPVQNPVDSAVRAVREAWAQPGLRDELLAGLGGIEEFGASLQECREAVRQRDIELRLDALEARRLAMLKEQDDLERRSAELRRTLKDEIRRDEAASLADAVQKTEAARAEQQKYEALAEEARATAQDARRAVEELTEGELERRLMDLALDQRMARRLEQLRGEAETGPVPPETEAPGLEAVVERIAERFAAEGRPLSRLEALNLAVCLGVSPVLMLSGPVGSGKTRTARLLAEAMGWTGERFAYLAPGQDAAEALAALDRLPDAPGMILADDANAARRAPWGLTAGQPAARRVALTLQDSHSGHAVPANVLDRGFTLRLSVPADAPWRPGTKQACLSGKPVALNDVFEALPAGDVPAACAEPMEALRKGLADCGAAVSRRALDEAWRYCAIMVAGMGEEADPATILDLAVAQRILPGLLAGAPLAALAKLPGLLRDFPRCQSLLEQPLPIRV